MTEKKSKAKRVRMPTDCAIANGIPFRGVTAETCLKAGVREFFLLDVDELAPHDEGVPCGIIVFPMYNVNKELVGLKYRDFWKEKFQNVDKSECISAEGSITLGGLHTLDMNLPEVCIWEGEPDWLTALQCDSTRNHLYLPGASNWKQIQEHSSLLRQFRKIYFGFDNDKAGRTLTENCMEFLPLHKVVVINYDETNTKDLNEAFLAGGVDAYNLLIRTARSNNSNLIITGSDLFSVCDRYFSSTEGMTNIKTKINVLDDLLGGGLRPGEFVALTAETGLGKSTLCADMAYSNMEDEIPAFWAGSEMQVPDMVRKFIERHMGRKITRRDDGKGWNIDKDDYYDVLNYLCKRIVFFNSKNLDWEQLYAAMLTAVYDKGVRVLYIDVVNDIDGINEWQRAEKMMLQLGDLAAGDISDARPPVSVVGVVHQRTVEGRSANKVALTKMAGGKSLRQKPTLIIGMEGDVSDTQRKLLLLKQSRMEGSEVFSGYVQYDKYRRRYVDVDSDDIERDGAIDIQYTEVKDAQFGLPRRRRRTQSTRID